MPGMTHDRAGARASEENGNSNCGCRGVLCHRTVRPVALRPRRRWRVGGSHWWDPWDSGRDGRWSYRHTTKVRLAGKQATARSATRMSSTPRRPRDKRTQAKPITLAAGDVLNPAMLLGERFATGRDDIVFRASNGQAAACVMNSDFSFGGANIGSPVD